MYNPISTYRIQFHKAFTTEDLQKHLEYLALLGVGTIYASPILKATPGSEHGYDVINPLELNPEVTDPEKFDKLHKHLQDKKLGWLQDIVPNHMAYTPDNQWLMDVLEKGADSEFAEYFDLEPGVPGHDHPLMVPFLGCQAEEAIKNNEVKLGFRKGNISVEYYDNIFPARFETMQQVIAEAKNFPAELQKLAQKYDLDNATADSKFLNSRWEEFKNQLNKLYQEKEEVSQFFEHQLAQINDDKEALIRILNSQHYELCYWQDTEKRINYRRFFTINGLICMKMEKNHVFDSYHKLIKELIDEGKIQGLRIDHIDGLNSPNEYLLKLRKLAGEQTYIVAEKILERDEDFPQFWPIEGSTGYDFLAIVNNLLTSTRDYENLISLYSRITQQHIPTGDLIYQNKRMILTSQMHGEWDNIFNYFNRLGFINYTDETISREEIKEALGEFMLACPVYRLYPRKFPLDKYNRTVVKEILDKALEHNPALTPALELLSKIILTNFNDEDHDNRVCEFFTRLMQFTGPLMAKGVEDTSMYQYRAFITHNEVGDAINAAGITIAEFHQLMQSRRQHWPYTMNTTSTHDTKRGEDVRARLNVISELTEEWEQMVSQWMQMNQRHKKRLDSGLLEPSLSIEYFIYQTLLGTFPNDGKYDETYAQRIDEYLVKALRESKRKVSWSSPDETYESTVCAFARKLLDPQNDFLASFVSFQQKVVWGGVINSLMQLTLKCTCPGIPDIYQGTELWDLTLVDPDNRQPVDYEYRHNVLQEIIHRHQANPVATLTDLIKNHSDGHIKLWLTYRLLNIRKKYPDLFLQGEYIPLEIQGNFDAHILAFARIHKNQVFVVAVPLFLASLAAHDSDELFYNTGLYNSYIILHESAPRRWINMISGAESEHSDRIPLQGAFLRGLPALLLSVAPEEMADK
jgi:malto-oligosyltrehalose synthase